MDIASISRSQSAPSTIKSSDVTKYSNSEKESKPSPDIKDSKPTTLTINDSNLSLKTKPSNESISSNNSNDSVALISPKPGDTLKSLNSTKRTIFPRSMSARSFTGSKHSLFQRSYSTKSLNAIRPTNFKRSFSSKSLRSIKSTLSVFSKPDHPLTKKEKFWRFVTQVITILLALIVIYTFVNILCSSYENNELKYYEYGIKLEVTDYTMIADIAGEQNEQVIVLLPEFGIASPVLYYKPLVEALSDKYKVVTLEPFGYGLSEYIETERSIEKIVNELHTAVQNLGIEQYYLMSHSISGLYSLYWSNQYGKEILGIIGLDSIVPGAEEIVKSKPSKVKFMAFVDFIGFQRMMSIFSSNNILVPLSSTYKYTEEDIKMFRIITLQRGYNKVQRKEISALMDNMNTVKAMKFPTDIPVLNFISSNYVNEYKNWKQIHIDVGNESSSNEVVEVSGEHSNFAFEQKETISKKIKGWTK